VGVKMKYCCDWCLKKFDSYDEFNEGKFVYNSFDLVFGHGCPMPHFPWHYVVVDLCNSCRERLFNKLGEMGIRLKKIQTDGTEHHFTMVREGKDWKRIS
jgi:hypothetical protein